MKLNELMLNEAKKTAWQNTFDEADIVTRGRARDDVPNCKSQDFFDNYYYENGELQNDAANLYLGAFLLGAKKLSETETVDSETYEGNKDVAQLMLPDESADDDDVLKQARAKVAKRTGKDAVTPFEYGDIEYLIKNYKVTSKPKIWDPEVTVGTVDGHKIVQFSSQGNYGFFRMK